MSGVDDIIGQWVKRAEKTGELRRGRYWSRPFDLQDGYLQTPAEWRMAHRVLKNAGYVPAEVEMMQQLAALKNELENASDEERPALRRRIAELQHRLAVRLEKRTR